MPDTLDLEITLSHSEADGYQAELQAYNLLGEVSRSLIAPIHLDLEALRQSQPDRDASEALLAAAIFNQPRLRAGLQDAIAAALPDRSLRLRLRIDASAPELLFLNQDVLLDPRDTRNFDYLPVGERLLIASEQAEQQRRVNRRLRVSLVVLALLCVAALAAGALAVLNNRGIVPNLAQARQAREAAFTEQTRAAQAQATATSVLGAAASGNRSNLDQQSTLAALATEVMGRQQLLDASATEIAQGSQAAATLNAAARVDIETNLRRAEQAQQTAVAAREEAHSLLEVAFSQFSDQLAIAALSSLAQHSDLASLLAAEAYCSADSPSARNALLTVLQASMANQIALIPPELDAFSPVRAVVYSPSGNWIAWGADDGPVTWKDTRSGFTFQDASEVRPRLVYALAFSPDERWLVSGSQDGTIVIRDLLTGESRQIGRLPAPVHGLYIDRENRLVAAVGDAVWPWLLDALWKSTEPLAGEPLIQQERDILSIAWDPVKRRLATGSQDGAVRIYEPGKDGVVLMEKAHTRAVRALAWSPDGSRLASAGDDGSVVIWDPLTGMPDGASLAEKVRRPLYGVSFSPDGRLLAAGGANNELVLWDVASRQEVAAVRDRFRDDITGLAFSPLKPAGKDLLLAGSASGQVALFSVLPEQILVVQQLPKVESGFLMALSNVAGEGVQGLALTTTGSEVIAASPGNETWQVLSPLFERVTAAAFSLDAKILALAQPVEDGQAVVSMVNTGDWGQTGRLDFPLAGEQTSSLFGLAFDARVTTLAASQCVKVSATNPECTPNQNHLQFQRISPIATLLQDVNVGENQPRLLAYDPLGRYLASAGEQAGVQLWPLSENGQALQAATPFMEILVDQRATALAFSFDGSLLAVGLEQGTVELWDTRSWQRLGYPLVGAEAQITALVFDLSGGWLTVASVDGTVKRWLVDPQAWATAACALTDRSMSETEWSLYFGSAAYNPACQRLIECKGK